MPTAKEKRKKKPSTYTYSGCWTCRKRHVKCPEEKPECSRCLKSGLSCSGYDFRFADSDSTRTFRRPVGDTGSTKWRQPALPSAKVSSILEELESSKSCQIGPFSVLSFEAKQPAETTSQQSPPRIEARHVEARTVAPPSNSPKGSRITTEIALFEPIPTYEEHAPSMVRELNLLTMPPKQARLFEFFTVSLSSTFSPMSGSPSNPFRYVYPSLAMEGLSATPEQASSRLALFHGICGTAAWSMRHIDSSYAALSLYHDGQALQFIQQTLTRREALLDALLPAAIMACLTGDNVAGRIELWGQHAIGGLRCLLGAVAQQKAKDSITSSICQSYLLLAACGNFGSPQDIETLRAGIIGSSYSYIEDCHGLTSPVLDSIIAINLLTASQNPYDPIRAECIRVQLLRAAPRFDEPFRHHLANVFYYAALIYYTKSVLRSGNTQYLVSAAIDHLELAAYFGPGRIGRILKWALFTVGGECHIPELRSRMAVWCYAQLSIQNIESFIGTLQSTWSVSRRSDLTEIGSAEVFPVEEIGG